MSAPGGKPGVPLSGHSLRRVASTSALLSALLLAPVAVALLGASHPTPAASTAAGGLHLVQVSSPPAKPASAPQKAAQRTRAGAVRASGRRAIVVRYARAQLGKPYRWGAAGPRSYDCSGLVSAAYRPAGRSLPHSADGIRARAHRVSRAAAQPGDVVIGSGHVGIYMGRGMMIDAGNPRVGISYRKMYGGLYVARLL